MTKQKDILEAYATWVEDLITSGWDPHFVTFMFNPLPGTTAGKWQQMQREIDRVYGRILSRTYRVPNAKKYDGRRPILIVAPDFPVFKYDRDHLVDIKINDGQHAHGLWLMPPWSRMKEDLSGHFLNYGHRYVGQGHGLGRIHSEKITHDPGRVVDYALKSVKHGRVSDEHIEIWPRGR